MPVITHATQRVFRNSNFTVAGIVTSESGGTHSSLFITTYEPKGYHTPHYHDEEHIITCLEGEGLLYLEKSPQPFGVGQTAVIPAGVRHAIINTGPESLRVAVFCPVVTPTTHWLSKNRRSVTRIPFVRHVYEGAAKGGEDDAPLRTGQTQPAIAVTAG